MNKSHCAMAAAFTALLLRPVGGVTATQTVPAPEGVQQHQRLTPDYPLDRDCSPLTSLYLSWDDVDGTKRSEPHSGVDGGRLGDAILAPAAGVVIAVWRADWGWGLEGALMIRHSREDLGLTGGPDFYYSEFDHLRYGEIRNIRIGKRVKRGERLATVNRPGGKSKYLPEVHWEVWAIGDDGATEWETKDDGTKDWNNDTGHLVDPLHMLSLNAPARHDESVEIPPFDAKRNYRGFRGFTYILPCPPLKARAEKR